MSFIVMTDTNSDIIYPYVEKHDIKIIYMPYFIDGQELFSDLGRSSCTQEFYAHMRSGITPTTALLTKDQYIDYFEPYLKARQDILFVSFSENLSNSIEQAKMAIAELSETYPDNRVVLCDSHTISFTEAMMAIKAAQLRAEGKTIDETAKWIEDNRMCYQSWFAVDDLVYLKRGGRLSSSAAMFGTMLDIKPILNITPDGRIVSTMKVKGRKKALRTLLDKFEEWSVDKSCAAILDADCRSDADFLESELKNAYPDIQIHRIPVGPVICTHCGPGTIALVFPSKPRA
ncbi:MAG: DegV family protein [Clostridiales bacterium]|nr:DegV family protein [Clostridiales bacterium]